MTHYEERLAQDLARIKDKVADLAQNVETAIQNALQALFSADEKLAYEVVLNDHAINRASRGLDKLCHKFFAVHLPSAGLLRYISATMRANLGLERIGDYAVTICRESVQIGHPPQDTIAKDMARLSDDTQETLKQAISAFNNSDADLAKNNIEQARDVTREFDSVFKELINQETKLPVQEMLYDLVIFTMLSRVVDQAKNICEETVFAVTGETKAPKTYHVLFLDQDNATLAPMAEAIARKNFPEWGAYASASKQAVNATNSHLVRFLEERGIKNPSPPTTLDPTADLSDCHVIVSLQGPVKSYIDTIPFSTIALEWEAGDPPTDSDDTAAQFEKLYRTLALQIQDLMDTIHGEEE